MKKNYLQNKIRNQEIKIEKLNCVVEDIKTQLSKFSKYEERVQETTKKALKELEEGRIQNFVKECVQDCFNETITERYEKLHFSIKYEAKQFLSSVKDLIKQFCDEVVFQRKDLGNILSILISKEIVTQEEFNQLDQKMLKEMEKSKVKEHVFNMFIPELEKRGKKRS